MNFNWILHKISLETRQDAYNRFNERFSLSIDMSKSLPSTLMKKALGCNFINRINVINIIANWIEFQRSVGAGKIGEPTGGKYVNLSLSQDRIKFKLDAHVLMETRGPDKL